MNSPPDKQWNGRLQSVLVQIRFTQTPVRLLGALTAVSELVQTLAPRFELAGIVLHQDSYALLGLEGEGAEIDGFLGMLKAAPYGLDVEVPWRLSVAEARYRRFVLADAVLTASERTWLRMEIESGFSDLATLPTLIDWLALRQFHGETISLPEVSAKIFPFTPKRS